MSILKIEKIGGISGFGTRNSNIRSLGEMRLDDLSEKDKKTIKTLFETKNSEKINFCSDSFRYKITLISDKEIISIETSEENIPANLRNCLKDELI